MSNLNYPIQGDPIHYILIPKLDEPEPKRRMIYEPPYGQAPYGQAHTGRPHTG